MMHAYNELYLSDSQKNLAGMFDYGIRGLGYSGDEFFSLFISSGIAGMFEHGNPKYVAGLSGIELAESVVRKSGKHAISFKPVDTSFDGPEYWTGWVLAYYQWYRAFRFSDLQNYGLVPSSILDRYILHEADISKFVESADALIRQNVDKSPAKLKQVRMARGLTQKRLAELSGVSLRMIQLYEQKQNDINKAAGDVITRLAWTLNCNFPDIMELNLD